MKRPRHPEYVCAALDALLAAIVIVVLALLGRVPTGTLLSPYVFFGLLVPFVGFTGVWGFRDARRQLSPGYRRIWSVSQGALITICAWATYWLVDGLAVAYACDDGLVWADATWSQRGEIGLMVLGVGAVLGGPGAIGALVLSEINSIVLASMPS